MNSQEGQALLRKEGRKEDKHSLAFGQEQAEEVVSTEVGKKKPATILKNS